MKHLKIICCLITILPNLAVGGPLSLAEAYQKALQYDASIAASRAENTAEKQEIDKARAAFLPQARLSMYRGRASTDSETPGSLGETVNSQRSYDSQNYNLSIRQVLFNKATFAEYGQAKAGVAKSDALLEKENASLITRLSGAYLDALLSLENTLYSQAQKTSLEAQLAQANKRYKSGVGTITEINEAQANLDDVIAKSLEWANNLEYAKQALHNLTGTYADQLLTLDASKMALTMLTPDKVDAWISLGLEKNPDILAAQQEVQMVMQEIEKNNAGHFPSLDLVASKSNTKSDNNYTIGSNYQTDSIGLQLNVPIYSGGYVTASVKQAVAKLNQAREKLVQQERATSADIRKYFNAMQNGIAKVLAYQQSVKSNEIAVIGTQKGFEVGIRSNVEVLNAQEKLYAAKRDLARERYQLIFNKIQLKQSSGSLTDADIQETSNLLCLKNQS
ncbi:TolC Outer membrane protein [Methylophilaceae bacterium]